MKREILEQKQPAPPITDEAKKLISDLNLTCAEVARRTGISAPRVVYYRQRFTNPEKFRERSQKCAADYMAKYNVKYKKRGWSEDEVEMIMRDDLPDREMSELLGRSIMAIRSKRHELRYTPFTSGRSIDKLELKNSGRIKRREEFIIEHFSDMTIDEVARELGISPGTVTLYTARLRAEGRIQEKHRPYRPPLSRGTNFKRLTDSPEKLATFINDIINATLSTHDCGMRVDRKCEDGITCEQCISKWLRKKGNGGI